MEDANFMLVHMIFATIVFLGSSGHRDAVASMLSFSYWFVEMTEINMTKETLPKVILHGCNRNDTKGISQVCCPNK